MFFFLFERVDFAALLLFLTVTLYVWKYNDNFFFNGDKYYTVCWIIISSCFKNSNFVLSQTSLRIYASLNFNVIPGFIKEVKKKLPFIIYFIIMLQIFFCREILQKGKHLLLIQCDTGDENSGLVECARHCIQRELQINKQELCVILLVHLSRVSKSCFSGFQVNTDLTFVKS